MKIEANLEFRKSEKRTSKNGNTFSMLKFEDDNGDILNLYAPINKDYTLEPAVLTKGSIVRLSLEYKYNSFDKNWRMELNDVLGYTDEWWRIICGIGFGDIAAK